MGDLKFINSGRVIILIVIDRLRLKMKGETMDEEKEVREEKPWDPDFWKQRFGGKSKREPVSGIVLGLMVIWLGVCLYLKHVGTMPADIWWAYMLFGFGCLWILGGLVRLFIPRWRHGVMGAFIPGIIAGSVGLMFILDSWEWWPLILVAVGLAIVISVLAQHFVKQRRENNREV